MNLTFLLAGFGFVAIAGVLYYFTSKSDEVEEEIKKEKENVKSSSAPVYEVIANYMNFKILLKSKTLLFFCC